MAVRKVKVSDAQPAPGHPVIEAWHWLSADGQLSHHTGEGVFVQPGKTYSVTGRIEPCENGLHGCETKDIRFWRDTVRWLGFTNPRRDDRILCKVQLFGEVKREADKYVARHRHVVAMVPVKKGTSHPKLMIALAALGLVSKPRAKKPATKRRKR